MKKIIIGLAGPEGVGKSSVAYALECRGIFRRMSFASPLYAAVGVMLDLPETTLRSIKEQVWTAQDAPVPALVGWSVRKMLQTLGTEYGRNVVHPDLWAQLAARQARHNKDHRHVVFDDVRFDNEAKNCDVVIELERKGVTYARTHASNQGVTRDCIHHQVQIVEGSIGATTDLIITHLHATGIL